eukprot:jgi/Tetstr1/457410/TSEL_044012.t1
MAASQLSRISQAPSAKSLSPSGHSSVLGRPVGLGRDKMASIPDLRSELENGDASHQTQALIVLLNHLSTERDVGNLPSLVCQKVIASGGTPPPVRRLAYDVVRLATLTAADWDAMCASVKADLTGQMPPETVSTALLLVPDNPPLHLVALVTREDIGASLASCLRSESAEVRAMAVTAMSSALNLPEMMEAICTSPGLVSSATEWWTAVANALLDGDDDVVATAHAALRLLFQAEHEGGHSTDGRQLRRRLVQHLTQHILYGLPPLLRRASRIPLACQVHVVQLLVLVLQLLSQAVASSGAPGSSQAWEAPPGGLHELELGARERGLGLFGAATPAGVVPSGALLAWAAQQVGQYLHQQMAMPDPAVMAEAARGLLQLACLPAPSLLQASSSPDPSAAFVAALPPPVEWTADAITCLLSLWGRPDSAVTRHDTILTCCAGLRGLEPGPRSAALRNLLQMACGLRQAAHRTEAFALLWAAALELDLGARRLAWGRRYPTPALLLSSVLEDSVVESVLKAAPAPGAPSHSKLSSQAGGAPAGASSKGAPTLPGPAGKEAGKDAGAGGAKPAGIYPEAREEMVATLLLSLLSHPQAAKPAGVEAAGDANVQAAHRQRLAEALDWVRAALVALQALAPVLSWDSAPTMLPDLWLHLLQRCAAVVRALVQQGPAPGRSSLMRRRAAAANRSPVPSATAADSVEDTHEELEAVQSLLGRLMEGLAGLRLALRPRALWVLVHHLNLHPEERPTWAALLGALQDMATEAAADPQRSHRLAHATSQGVLPAMDTPHTTEPHPGGDATQLQTLVLCLERMAGLLSLAQYAQAEDEAQEAEDASAALVSTLDDDQAADHVPRTAQQVRAAVDRLLQSGAALGPDVTDVCHRIRRQLVTLESGRSHGAPPGRAGACMTPHLAADVGGFGMFREEDLAVAEGYPFGESAAQGVPVPGRAGKLDDMVRTAVAAATAARRVPLGDEGSCSAELAAEGLWALGVPPAGGHQAAVPTAAELVAALGGPLPPVPGASAAAAAGVRSGRAPERAGWQPLTGASDAVQLMARHVASSASNTVGLHLKLTNLLPGEELESVVVSLGLLGPLHTESRQPAITWRPAALVPQEAQQWEARLWVSSFGRCQVQPRVKLAKGRREGQVVELAIRCRPYDIPMTDLLQAPSMAVPAARLFQQWDALPAQWEGRAFAHCPGVGQAPALLAAMETCTPMQRVWLRGLPSLGGFQAAFQASTWAGDTVAAILVAQLLPTEEAPPAGSALDSGRLAVRLSVRSSSQSAVHAIRADPGAWVSALSGGLLRHGPAPPPPSQPLLRGGPRLGATASAPPTQLGGASGRSTPAGSTTDLLSDFGDGGAEEAGGAAGGMSAGEAALQDAALQEWKRLGLRSHAAAY